jgi:carbon monoxide dehydrogenase subunit G
MTVRADVDATIDDGDGSGPVRLEMSGRPRGLTGTFGVTVPFELEPAGEGTRVTYEVDLRVSGRLAAFGRLILRDATRRQIAELVRNVEREASA